MASTRLKTTKAGKRFYEIRVRTGRNAPELTKRWYVPDGWGQKAINKELNRVAVEFENQCHAGEILTRAQKKEQAAQEAAQAARILTVKQYGERVFMPAKTLAVAESTRATYQKHLDFTVYPAIGDIRLPEVSGADINALLLALQKQGKHETAISVHSVLSGLFKMAYVGDLIQANPMDKVIRPRPRKNELKDIATKAYTEDELIYITKCLENEPLQWQAFIRLLMDTGMRCGECCALRWKDIDFKNNRITISGTMCYTKERGLYRDSPKNGHSRTISIDASIVVLLRQLRSKQANNVFKGYLFTQTQSAAPIYPSTASRYLARFGKRYNLPGIHPHKLRHSFASVAIERGADVASVAGVLGHMDKTITLRTYTHANQNGIDRAGDIFREALQAKEEKEDAQ